MLTRPDRRARPVVREKSGEDVALWRIFDPTFTGKVELLPCAEGEGFNLDIVDNFRIPKREALNAPLLQGKGILGALGKFEAKGAPKKHAEKKHAEKIVRGRQKKKPEATVVPSLVPHAAGGGAAVGRTSAGSKPADEKKKRKIDDKAARAGEKKRPRIQIKRTTAVSQAKPAVAAEPQDGDFSSLFDAPLSPPYDTAADTGVNKEFTGPFVKVVSEPSVQAEDTRKKTVAQIYDTVDSSDNLISPEDTGDLNLKFADGEKQKSDAEKHKTPTAEKASGSASGGTGFEGPPIQPEESELEHYFRTYTEDWAVNYHRPPWSVMQGDDISTDPSACKEILGGLGTPFEVNRARALRRELRINQLSSMLVGSSIMANAIMEDYKVLGRKEEETARLRAEAEELVKAAREGAEQLKREKAAFEQYTQTEKWAATAGLKQELTNVKAANAALVKEKAAALEEAKEAGARAAKALEEAKEAGARATKALEEANSDRNHLSQTVVGLQEKAAAAKALEEAKEAGARAAKALEEAKEAGARATKALEEANSDRTHLSQTVVGLQAEVQNRVTMLAEVTARATEAKARAREAAEARDGLVSTFNQLKDDRDWMRDHGIGHIVKAILDAPENAAGVDLIRMRARDAGFKAGYN
ncbi:uncharacterized protein LOC110870249 [Helianthus annuus]|uniref:uncharacterized protein LOC110870249 n=1 Tax=Helianthus annuus TaxID=4232 RepID=UPI000B902DAC|nr:uncharacterized protein LOC110870249 [Helianthus annuus]